MQHPTTRTGCASTRWTAERPGCTPPVSTARSPTPIESRLDEGLREAGVEVEADERRRIVVEIDDIRRHETQAAPEVGSAQASGDPEG